MIGRVMGPVKWVNTPFSYIAVTGVWFPFLFLQWKWFLGYQRCASPVRSSPCGTSNPYLKSSVQTEGFPLTRINGKYRLPAF